MRTPVLEVAVRNAAVRVHVAMPSMAPQVHVAIGELEVARGVEAGSLQSTRVLLLSGRPTGTIFDDEIGGPLPLLSSSQVQ